MVHYRPTSGHYIVATFVTTQQQQQHNIKKWTMRLLYIDIYIMDKTTTTTTIFYLFIIGQNVRRSIYNVITFILKGTVTKI